MAEVNAENMYEIIDGSCIEHIIPHNGSICHPVIKNIPLPVQADDRTMVVLNILYRAGCRRGKGIMPWQERRRCPVCRLQGRMVLQRKKACFLRHVPRERLTRYERAAFQYTGNLRLCDFIRGEGLFKSQRGHLNRYNLPKREVCQYVWKGKIAGGV